MTETTTTPTVTAATALTPGAGTTQATSNVGDGTSGTTAQTSGQAVEWLPGLEAEVSTYIAGKGFKDPQSLAKSYMNLEKQFATRGFELPKAEDTAAWAKIREAAGVPAAADKYDLGELGKKLDPAGLKPWLDLFHAEGLTSKQAQTLLSTVMTNAGQAEQAKEADFVKRSETETEAVLQEWGENKDANIDLSRRGVAKLAESLGGLNAEELKGLERALGSKKLMSLGLWLGKQTQESKIIAADGKSFNLSQPEAERRIAAFKTGPLAAALVDKRHPDHAAASREWQQLLAIGYGQQS